MTKCQAWRECQVVLYTPRCDVTRSRRRQKGVSVSCVSTKAYECLHKYEEYSESFAVWSTLGLGKKIFFKKGGGGYCTIKLYQWLCNISLAYAISLSTKQLFKWMTIQQSVFALAAMALPRRDSGIVIYNDLMEDTSYTNLMATCGKQTSCEATMIGWSHEDETWTGGPNTAATTENAED